eukprot:superscaffoldBa00002854_g15464
MLLVAVVLYFPSLAHGFQPLIFNENSITHRQITERAVLRKTAEVCRDFAASAGQDFSLVIDNSLSAGKVQRACSSVGTSTLLSTAIFQTSIAQMYFANAKVDVEFILSDTHHFVDEAFQGGRDLITEGVSYVKASVKL